MYNSIYELFENLNTCMICVKNYNIIVDGTLVTHIYLRKNKISIWAGDPTKDKYAEELIPSKGDKKRIFEEILEYSYDECYNAAKDWLKANSNHKVSGCCETQDR